MMAALPAPALCRTTAALSALPLRRTTAAISTLNLRPATAAIATITPRPTAPLSTLPFRPITAALPTLPLRRTMMSPSTIPVRPITAGPALSLGRISAGHSTLPLHPMKAMQSTLHLGGITAELPGTPLRRTNAGPPTLQLSRIKAALSGRAHPRTTRGPSTLQFRRASTTLSTIPLRRTTVVLSTVQLRRPRSQRLRRTTRVLSTLSGTRADLSALEVHRTTVGSATLDRQNSLCGPFRWNPLGLPSYLRRVNRLVRCVDSPPSPPAMFLTLSSWWRNATSPAATKISSDLESALPTTSNVPTAATAGTMSSSDLPTALPTTPASGWDLAPKLSAQTISIIRLWCIVAAVLFAIHSAYRFYVHCTQKKLTPSDEETGWVGFLKEETAVFLEFLKTVVLVKADSEHATIFQRFLSLIINVLNYMWGVSDSLAALCGLAIAFVVPMLKSCLTKKIGEKKTSLDDLLTRLTLIQEALKSSSSAAPSLGGGQDDPSSGSSSSPSPNPTMHCHTLFWRKRVDKKFILYNEKRVESKIQEYLKMNHMHVPRPHTIQELREQVCGRNACLEAYYDFLREFDRDVELQKKVEDTIKKWKYI